MWSIGTGKRSDSISGSAPSVALSSELFASPPSDPCGAMLRPRRTRFSADFDDVSRALAYAAIECSSAQRRAGEDGSARALGLSTLYFAAAALERRAPSAAGVIRCAERTRPLWAADETDAQDRARRRPRSVARFTPLRSSFTHVIAGLLK